MPAASFLGVAAPHPAATVTACDAFPAEDVGRVLTMPLVNALTSDRLGTAADPLWLRFGFSRRRPLRYAGLWVNLQQSARWRLQAFADEEESVTLFDSRRADGRDRRVIPRLFARRRSVGQVGGVRWGASNCWRLDLPTDQYLLFPGVIHCVFPECRPRVMRWSFHGGALAPDGSAATWTTVGFAPVGNGLDIARLTGSTEGHDPRADVQRVSGGGSSVEPGTTLRTAAIDLRLIDPGARRELHALTAQAGNDLPVIYLPQQDDAAENFLFGGVFRIGPGGTGFGRATGTVSDVKINLEEWRE